MPDATHQLVPCLLQARKTSRRERVFDLLFNRKARGDERAIYAHLALKPAEKAIIFVHGFAGRALQTWTLFPEMLQGEPKTAGYDLIFFEYDSFSTQLGNIVSRLKTFLSEIMTNASPTINRGLARPDHRPPGFAYKNIVIVAHSLGAVVTRRTLLDYQGNKTTWVPHTEFMRFAPADQGAFGTALLSGVVERLLGSAPWPHEWVREITAGSYELGAEWLRTLGDERELPMPPEHLVCSRPSGPSPIIVENPISRSIIAAGVSLA
jgi:hypothetical protein